MKDLIAQDSRKKCLELVYKAQSSHIGSLFSCAELMAAIFDRINLDVDKFVLSAGWKACMLYYHLWRKGRITEAELDSYCQPGSKFIGLSEPIHPDIAFAGGSMSMGIAAAVGFALAKKMKHESGTVYVLMSDGELQCGTTWESFMIAAQHNLNNLCVLVDRNGLQAMGSTDSILDLEDLGSRLYTFGWCTCGCDGHDIQQIDAFLDGQCDVACDSPKILIANTVKGKGVSFMENNNLYHYKNLTKGEYESAMRELNAI